MKKDMCESCYYCEISIVDGYSKYPFLHKTKFYSKFCLKKFCVISKFVTYEKIGDCGYIPKSGQIDKKHYQKSMCEY